MLNVNIALKNEIIPNLHFLINKNIKNNTEIFTEIGLPNDTDSMVSLTRINPNPSRTTPNPPPLRMTLIDFSYSFTSIENVLSAAKKLKGSEKFNKVFIDKDLTTVEIV